MQGVRGCLRREGIDRKTVVCDSLPVIWNRVSLCRDRLIGNPGLRSETWATLILLIQTWATRGCSSPDAFLIGSSIVRFSGLIQSKCGLAGSPCHAGG